MALVKAPLEGAQLDPNPKSDLVVLVIAPGNDAQPHAIRPPKKDLGASKTPLGASRGQGPPGGEP